MRVHGTWLSRHPTLAKVLVVAIAVLLAGWSAYGVLYDDVAVPVRHGHGRYHHFHGAAAWLMSAGFACLSASLLMFVALRAKANPGGTTSQRVAGGLGLVGVVVVLAMMALKSMGFV